MFWRRVAVAAKDHSLCSEPRELLSEGAGNGFAPICERGVPPWMRPGEGDAGGRGPGGPDDEPDGGPDGGRDGGA